MSLPYHLNSGSEDKEYGGGDTSDDFAALRPAPIVPRMVLTICNLRWCSFSVDPICMCTHTNEHVLQLAHSGGCRMCVCVRSRCALTMISVCVCGV